MVVDMKENIKMIVRMVMEYLLGLMGDNMKECGKMGNNMGLVHLESQIGNKE